jgi:hypothetical protein
VAQVIPSAQSAHSTREALGAGLGLLGTFIAAMFFAFLLPRLAVYVTFLMPVLVGFLLSALGAIGPRRFGYGNAKALIGMMVAGTVILWIGHHIFAYLRLVDYLALQHAAAGVAGTDPVAAAMSALEEQTGESGFWAYLTFVSRGVGAQISPIGVLGKLEIGAWGTVMVAVVELGLMASVACWSILFRTRHLRSDGGEPVPLGLVDEAALADIIRLVEARRFEEAGAVIASPFDKPTHVVMLRDGGVTTEAQMYTLDADGRPDEKIATKLLPIEGGQRLREGFGASLRGKA